MAVKNTNDLKIKRMHEILHNSRVGSAYESVEDVNSKQYTPITRTNEILHNSSIGSTYESVEDVNSKQYTPIKRMHEILHNSRVGSAYESADNTNNKQYKPISGHNFKPTTEEGNELQYVYKNKKDATEGYRTLLNTSDPNIKSDYENFFNANLPQLESQRLKAEKFGNVGLTSLNELHKVNPIKFDFNSSIVIPTILKVREYRNAGIEPVIGQYDIKRFYDKIGTGEFGTSLKNAGIGKNDDFTKVGLFQTYHNSNNPNPGDKPSLHFANSNSGHAAYYVRAVWGDAMEEIQRSALENGIWHKQWEDDAVMIGADKESVQRHIENVKGIIKKYFGADVDMHDVIDYTDPTNAMKIGTKEESKSGIRTIYQPLSQFKQVTDLSNEKVVASQKKLEEYHAGSTTALHNIIATNEILHEDFGSVEAGKEAQKWRDYIGRTTDMTKPIEVPLTKIKANISPLKFSAKQSYNYEGKYNKFQPDKIIKPSHNDMIEARKHQLRSQLSYGEPSVKGEIDI